MSNAAQARGSTMGPMDSLGQLREQREAILAIAAKWGASSVRVFGSVARGEAGPGSDVDLIINLERGRSLFDWAGFTLDLEDLLGRKVDVVIEGGQNQAFEQRILGYAVAL